MTFLASMLAVLLAGSAVPAAVANSWVDGEMGYRVTLVPDGSPAARHGIRVGDILAEPQPLPGRLRDAGPGGVEIPIFRLNRSNGTYEPARLTITFLEGEEHRLVTTGDLGFLVTGVRPGTLGARAELQPGDFIPKIDDTFVHDVTDLKLVDEAYEKGEQVLIHFTRWSPQTSRFTDAVSRRRFVK
jgi:S1-C subfamily serine protease